MTQVRTRESRQAPAAAARPAVAAATPRHPIHRLQRVLGNQAVGRLLAAHSAETAPAELEAAVEARRGDGEPLPRDVRDTMEEGFGADLGQVRVHRDGDADHLSRAFGARAFATGADIFFSRGSFAPGTSSGRELIAHELAHVLQDGGSRGRLEIAPPSDPAEAEADLAARSVTARETQEAGE